jgi:hypothetical protein
MLPGGFSMPYHIKCFHNSKFGILTEISRVLHLINFIYALLQVSMIAQSKL